MGIDPALVIARIGDMPIGDPTAMRRHAARLHDDASRIMELVREADRRAYNTVYSGPAADALRGDVDDCLRGTSLRTERLHRAADALLHAANSVEAAQDSWRGLFRRVERELEAAALGRRH